MKLIREFLLGILSFALITPNIYLFAMEDPEQEGQEVYIPSQEEKHYFARIEYYNTKYNDLARQKKEKQEVLDKRKQDLGKIEQIQDLRAFQKEIEEGEKEIAQIDGLMEFANEEINKASDELIKLGKQKTQEPREIQLEVIKNMIGKSYGVVPFKSTYENYIATLDIAEYSQFSRKDIKDSTELLKNFIVFEFKNKSDKTIYVQFGNFNEWLSKGEWIPLESGASVFSIEPVTQFAYSAKLNPQFVEDVEYVVFDRGETDKKVFVKLEKKDKTLRFMTQEGRAPGRILPGRALKFGREWLGVEKGAISITQSGLSLKNSINDEDIIWLPYLKLNFSIAMKAQGFIRNWALDIIKYQNDRDMVNKIIKKAEENIAKQPSVFIIHLGEWSPLHEINLWRNSTISNENETVRHGLLGIYYALISDEISARSKGILEITDVWGQSADEILTSPVVRQAVDTFIKEQSQGIPEDIEEELKVKKRIEN